MPDTTPSEADGLWVRSEVMPTGTYGVAITVGADRAWSLNRDRAVAYATACFARATEAEHDTAIIGLLTKRIHMTERSAASFVALHIREDRPTDDTATRPLAFHPSVGRHGPFLDMLLDGERVGQLTPADLRDHAAAVLNVLAAADLDAAARRALMTMGLDESRCYAFVSELGQHWPDQGAPRRVASHPSAWVTDA